MEDGKIIELFFKRDETALKETHCKYGAFCHMISFNILKIKEDSEECVNDTYLKAWTTIPPVKPLNLKYYLGRIVRNISLNLWNKNHAVKRYSGLEMILDELSECIPSNSSILESIEEKELVIAIENWLKGLEKEKRKLFIRRYWYGTQIKELSKECSVPSSVLSKRLFDLRKNLKEALSKEGFSV